MRIVDFVSATGITVSISAANAEGTVRELATALARLNGLDLEQVTTLLLERERLGSTAIGQEIAVPHARFDLPRTVGVIGLSERGIDFGAPDGVPVRIVVAFLSPQKGGAHLHALAAVARELSDASFRASLVGAKTASEIHALLAAAPTRGAAIPSEKTRS